MEKVEQYIKEHINRYSNHVELAPYITGFTEWLTLDDARRAVEIAREEAVERACEYLNGLIEILNDHGHGLKKERIIGELKQAMEDE